jgi:hypothetical protein
MPLDADILKKPVGTCCLNVAISEKEVLGHFGAILPQNSFFLYEIFLGFLSPNKKQLTYLG